MPMDDFIFNRIMNRVNPQYYCENVLRAHLPEKRRHLHENQLALLNAVANPRIRRVSALMSRQAGKTETIASFSGFLCDNYPSIKIGIFTPRIQQAEVSLGRVSVFYQMNEEKLNNKIVKMTKDKIQLSNNSFILLINSSFVLGKYLYLFSESIGLSSFFLIIYSVMYVFNCFMLYTNLAYFLNYYNYKTYISYL